jgi:threonine dehydratase
VLRTRLRDRPGELAQLLQLLGSERVNVMSVEHHREGMEIGVGETEVELTMLMRNSGHCDRLVETMQRWGYVVRRVR